MPITVAVNHFVNDTNNEIDELINFCNEKDIKATLCTHWSNGGEGTKEIASHVVELINKEKNNFKFLYEDNIPLLSKIEKNSKRNLSCYRSSCG